MITEEARKQDYHKNSHLHNYSYIIYCVLGNLLQVASLEYNKLIIVNSASINVIINKIPVT